MTEKISKFDFGKDGTDLPMFCLPKFEFYAQVSFLNWKTCMLVIGCSDLAWEWVAGVHPGCALWYIWANFNCCNRIHTKSLLISLHRVKTEPIYQVIKFLWPVFDGIWQKNSEIWFSFNRLVTEYIPCTIRDTVVIFVCIFLEQCRIRYPDLTITEQC